MEEIDQLIRQYGLEEDPEHVIIPYTDKDGRKKRCYLLKRRFIRILYGEDRHIDYPLAQVIEATVRHPELRLSEALNRLYSELDIQPPEPKTIETENSGRDE
ncbi:MAG: hypothetical protein ACOYVJ_09305 [Nitrospirota bacterium]